MDPVDLHAWANRHLSDPELGEVARGVRDLIAANLTQSVTIELVGELLDTPPVLPAFWVALDRLALFVRSRQRP